MTYAQQIETTIHFELDKYEHVDTLHNNAESYSGLDKLLNYLLVDSTYTIEHISIYGNTSPEAGRAYNKILSQNRANVIRDYIVSTHKIDSMHINSVGNGTPWGYLYSMVSDSDMPFRHLKNLRNGQPYEYLLNELFPLMRNSNIVTIIHSRYLSIDVPPLKHELILPEPSFDVMPQQSKPGYAFALKSNLLGDLLTVANIELEFPIKQRLSVTGEYTFPWWYGAKSNFTMRTQMVHLGVNYWLGNRSKYEVLTGWHIGAMAGYASKYDIQIFDESGIQGDYKMAGVNIGYTHSIYKSLRLEYQLGVGYICSDYRNYTMAYGTRYDDIKVFDYPWELKVKTWIGPTQARVSLAWLINCKKCSSYER